MLKLARNAAMLLLCSGATLAAWAAVVPAPLSEWQEVVRRSPYWESQGVHANLVTIRRWVLHGEAFCAQEERHILFDRRATFLGYLSHGETPQESQELIDRQRQELAASGRVDVWVPGQLGGTGYPFALSCQHPQTQLSAALARYTGDDPQARLWGSWDGMQIGSEQQPVSLHEAVRQVYDYRRQTGRISLPEHVLSTLAGKILIESGAVPEARSASGALGIMQLTVAALNDCEIPANFHFHRLAQIDCALYLLEQNHRNLKPVFDAYFGHLPANKAEDLYDMLLLQAYHGGVGRVRALMTDETLNGAARYFAEHHARFTAGDIALGMIFHNLGRDRFGFASLYYVTDVGIAAQMVCARMNDLPGC